jgi:hypothetical protein
VNALRFTAPDAASAAKAFTLTGGPLTLGNRLTADWINVSIGNDLTLARTDTGRGLEVEFGGTAIPPAVPPGPVAPLPRGVDLTGAIAGPARIRLTGSSIFRARQASQNAGGPIGAIDPGVNLGLIAEDTGALFIFAPTTERSYTLFGNANTAIGLISGGFGFQETYTFDATTRTYSLTLVPEPTAYLVAGTAGGLLECRRRRPART